MREQKDVTPHAASPPSIARRDFERARDRESTMIVAIAGTDVTASIRDQRVDRMVSVVARHPEVRTVMRARQREISEDGNTVVEGRDIGTVVAPRAGVKVYLIADREVRARRRMADRPG